MSCVAFELENRMSLPAEPNGERRDSGLSRTKTPLSSESPLDDAECMRIYQLEEQVQKLRQQLAETQRQLNDPNNHRITKHEIITLSNVLPTRAEAFLLGRLEKDLAADTEMVIEFNMTFEDRPEVTLIRLYPKVEVIKYVTDVTQTNFRIRVPKTATPYADPFFLWVAYLPLKPKGKKAPEVFTNVMTGRLNFSACFISRSAFRYPSGDGIP